MSTEAADWHMPVSITRTLTATNPNMMPRPRRIDGLYSCNQTEIPPIPKNTQIEIMHIANQYAAREHVRQLCYCHDGDDKSGLMLLKKARHAHSKYRLRIGAKEAWLSGTHVRKLVRECHQQQIDVPRVVGLPKPRLSDIYPVDVVHRVTNPPPSQPAVFRQFALKFLI